MNTMPLSAVTVLDRIRVVLSHPSHPGNIGAAARAMKAMGLSRLVLVTPKLFPDAQADAMAAGATDLLVQAEVVESLAQALSGTVLAVAMTARRRELAVPALWARDAAAELVSIAGRYRISEQIDPADRGRAMQIHLVEDRLIIEHLAADRNSFNVQ